MVATVPSLKTKMRTKTMKRKKRKPKSKSRPKSTLLSSIRSPMQMARAKTVRRRNLTSIEIF